MTIGELKEMLSRHDDASEVRLAELLGDDFRLVEREVGCTTERHGVVRLGIGNDI